VEEVDQQPSLQEVPILRHFIFSCVCVRARVCVCVWKNIVYAVKIRDLGHQRQRIAATVATITPDMLRRTRTETEYHLDVYWVTMVLTSTPIKAQH
jgi:hypothetical protein